MIEQTLIVAAPSGLRVGDVIIEVSVGGDPEGPRMVWVRREAPSPPLPTRPGYYAAERPSYGGPVVVELLASPSGQWVDAGDGTYLSEVEVQRLGTLQRLVPLASVIDYFEREAGDAGHADWRRRAAATIRAEWEDET